METPFFSIVIATFNYGQFLEEAIESVLSQSCKDYELIIVDGGSTDNTIEVIKKYEKYLAWWVSEPDNGQSNAFNKGFRHSNGKYLTWLNADDVYLPGALESVKRTIERNPQADWATGNFIRFRDEDKVIIEAQWGPHHLPKYLQTFDSPICVFGPTTFWSREVYNQVGDLDEKLHFSMDTDYWLRIIKQGFLQVRVNHDIWAFRMHNASKTAEYDDHKADEETAQKKNAEKKYKADKLHYKLSRVKYYLYIVHRCIDGSAFKGMCRNLFVKGKTLSVYGI